MGRSLHQFRLVDLESIRLDHDQPAGAVVEFGQKRQEPRVLLDQYDLAGVALQQGAGQAAGAGADLDHGPTVERPGQTHDLSGHVQVEQEMLAETLFRQQAVGVERFAEGGEVGGVHRGFIGQSRDKWLVVSGE